MVTCSQVMLEFTLNIANSYRLQKFFYVRNQRAGQLEQADNETQNNHCKLHYNYDLDIVHHERLIHDACRRTKHNMRVLGVSRVKSPNVEMSVDVAVQRLVSKFCNCEKQLEKLNALYQKFAKTQSKLES
ncbi:hypothetical protein GJ496_011337 [Pomphorhynchus laevis]|nr:hypothetical protein GJ496_011337 [Pomphorhynchus laevis]